MQCCTVYVVLCFKVQVEGLVVYEQHCNNILIGIKTNLWLYRADANVLSKWERQKTSVARHSVRLFFVKLPIPYTQCMEVVLHFLKCMRIQWRRPYHSSLVGGFQREKSWKIFCSLVLFVRICEIVSKTASAVFDESSMPILPINYYCCVSAS